MIDGLARSRSASRDAAGLGGAARPETPGPVVAWERRGRA